MKNSIHTESRPLSSLLAASIFLLALSAWAGLAYWIGDFFLFTQGFSDKFHTCLDIASEIRLSHGLFFLPQALALLLLRARPLAIALFGAISTLVFYGFISLFWTGIGCFWNYELIYFVNALFASAIAFFWAPLKFRAQSATRASILASFVACALSAGSIGFIASRHLEPDIHGIHAMTAGLWMGPSAIVFGVFSVILAAFLPSAIISIRTRQPAFLPVSSSMASLFCFAVVAAPHALEISARLVEPVTLMGAFLPLILAGALRFAAEKRRAD